MRYKLLLFALVSVVAFSAKDIVYGSITFFLVAAMVFSMGQMRLAVKYAAVYALVLGIIHLASYLPPVLAGVLLMLTLCVRMFMPILLFAQAFSATTTISEIVTALYKMRVPRSLIITFAAAMRFFPTVKEEVGYIHDALRLRGLNLTARNLLTRPGLLFEGYMTPLIMRSATVSEELSAASVTRGLDNPAPRSSFYVLRVSWQDTLFTLVWAVLLSGVFVAKVLA